MYAGRVAVEKNLDAFLSLDLPGTKVVVGDGPDRGELAQRYPAAMFPGYRFGVELASYLSAADVFVFPSRTDTFGLVMLEAMACGTPVAAFPVTGPIDVVTPGVDGVLNEDLGRGRARGARGRSRRLPALGARPDLGTRVRTIPIAPRTGERRTRSPGSRRVLSSSRARRGSPIARGDAATPRLLYRSTTPAVRSAFCSVAELAAG